MSNRLLRYIITLFVSLGLIMAMSVGQSSAQPKAKEKKPVTKNIIIGTSSSGGAFYIIGSTLGRIMEDHAGIRGTPQVTAGSAENARLVADKKVELGGCSSETLLAAYRGEGVFKAEKLDNLRGVMALYSFDLILVTLPKTPINNFAGLKGKRVGVGPPGSATMISAQVLTEGHGMTFNDFKAMPLGFNDMYSALGDGHLDAIMTMSAHPSSGILNLATMQGLKFIPLEDRILDKIAAEKAEFYKATIAPSASGGPYKEIKEPYKTMGTTYILMTHKDMDEKTVYDITKAILENIKDYEKAHPQMRDIRSSTALNGMPIPVHSGAERYYKEKGIKK